MMSMDLNADPVHVLNPNSAITDPCIYFLYIKTVKHGSPT